MISREFTVSIKEKRFKRDLAGLLEIIQATGRAFHVVLLGVGPRTAPTALNELTREGCTATLVTGSPIREGQHGKQLNSQDGGGLLAEASERDSMNLPEHNLAKMAEFAEDIQLFTVTSEVEHSLLYAFHIRRCPAT